MEEYSVKLPYPEISLPRNAAWAGAMLNNFAGLNSELGAVTSYTYRSITQGGDSSELGKCMMELAKVEMRHLERFGLCAKALGTDPRYWYPRGAGFAYWSPCPLNYSQKPAELLTASIREEKAAIEKYNGQINAIADKGLQMLLARIVLDEELHLRILEDLFGKYA